MFDNFINMQVELKKNVLKDYFENYGTLVNHYLDKAEASATKGNKIMVNYWTRKALSAIKARYRIMCKLGVLAV